MTKTEHSHSHEDTSSKTQAEQNITPSSTTPIPVPANKMAVPQEFSSHHDSFTDMYGHPAATRASVFQAAQEIGYGKPESPAQHRGRISIDHDGTPPSSYVQEQAKRGDGNLERSSLRPQNDLMDIAEGSSTETRNEDEFQDLEGGVYTHEQHRTPTNGASGGSHGSMNMHALILHVIGDALGNVGVIATGLVIWLSTWEYKYYFDPVVSLVITVIIFSSALPLGKPIFDFQTVFRSD